MPIDTVCPRCTAKLRIGEEFAGQQARCPRCDGLYTVPSAAAAPLTDALAADEPPPGSLEPAPTADLPVQDAPSPMNESAMAATTLPELPPADGRHWLLRTPEGPIYGPADEDQFRQWAHEGRVTIDCLVSAGDHQWRAAGDVFPELAAPRPKVTLRPETIDSFRLTPHRGALLLLLGIMGIVTTCPIPSIMAWVMGSHDLAEMEAGRMDSDGQGLTAAGRMLGLIFSLVYIVLAVVGMFLLVWYVARV